MSDAYRLLPEAEILYSCDRAWWLTHNGCPDFAGARWSTHSEPDNPKRDLAWRFGLHVIEGRVSTEHSGFSLEPSFIRYGANSGFQAINLAILRYGRPLTVLLVGFDMQSNGKRHFFGDHPEGLSNAGDFRRFIPFFRRAAKLLPKDIEIVNCTPGSALTCFPMARLEDALSDLAHAGRT